MQTTSLEFAVSYLLVTLILLVGNCNVLIGHFPRIFREQKRVAKVIIGSQEEAYWRLVRPPVSNCVCVCGGRERERGERIGEEREGGEGEER